MSDVGRTLYFRNRRRNNLVSPIGHPWVPLGMPRHAQRVPKVCPGHILSTKYFFCDFLSWLGPFLMALWVDLYLKAVSKINTLEKASNDLLNIHYRGRNFFHEKFRCFSWKNFFGAMSVVRPNPVFRVAGLGSFFSLTASVASMVYGGRKLILSFFPHFHRSKIVEWHWGRGDLKSVIFRDLNFTL